MGYAETRLRLLCNFLYHIWTCQCKSVSMARNADVLVFFSSQPWIKTCKETHIPGYLMQIGYREICWSFANFIEIANNCWQFRFSFAWRNSLTSLLSLPWVWPKYMTASVQITNYHRALPSILNFAGLGIPLSCHCIFAVLVERSTISSLIYGQLSVKYLHKEFRKIPCSGKGHVWYIEVWGSRCKPVETRKLSHLI